MDAVTTSFDYNYDFDFDGFEATTTGAELNGVSTGLGALFAGVGIFFYLLALAAAIITIVAQWKIFVKAGKPGWAALIPIYNFWVLLEVAGLPGWLVLIPFALPILNIVIAIKLPQKFGKEAIYAVGLIFLPIVFYPLLAFGKCEYQDAPVVVDEVE